MDIEAKVKHVEKKIREQKLESKVNMFDSRLEFDQAVKRGDLGENDVNIIDNIPKSDEGLNSSI